jgi:hypothetical protein
VSVPTKETIMSMIKTSLLASCLLAATASSALAQEAVPARPLKVGADLGVVMPLGDWGDFSGIGFGPIARISYAINPKLSIVGRPGYIYHLGKSQDFGGFEVDMSTSEMLLIGGVQYNVSSAIGLSAATGLNIWGIKMSADGQSESTSNTRVPLLLDVVYSMPNGVTVGGGLLIPNLLLTKDGESMEMGVMANVGYTFMR